MFSSVKYLDGDREEKKEITRAGRLIATFNTGDTFEGTYADEGQGLVRVGHGVYTWRSKAKYEGDYHHGKRHGQGKYTFPSGDLYEGGWVDGVKSGKGKYTYLNGDIFYGTWANDKRHGEGRFVAANKKTEIRGEWKAGYVVEGSYKEVPYQGMEVSELVVSKPVAETVKEAEQIAPIKSADKKEEPTTPPPVVVEDKKEESTPPPVEDKKEESTPPPVEDKKEESPLPPKPAVLDVAPTTKLEPPPTADENDEEGKEAIETEDPELPDTTPDVGKDEVELKHEKDHKKKTINDESDNDKADEDEHEIEKLEQAALFEIEKLTVTDEALGMTEKNDETNEETVVDNADDNVAATEGTEKNEKSPEGETTGTPETDAKKEEAKEPVKEPLSEEAEDFVKNAATTTAIEVEVNGKKPLSIVIAGAPASGKGTQCAKISEHFGVVHLSTGDMLREAVKNETEFGLKAKEFMDKGDLVPDEIVNEIIKERLEQEDVKENGMLLDGYPRTKNQAEQLKVLGVEIDCCVLLEVDEPLLIERAVGRRLDPVTNTIYHLKFHPPPEDEEVQARLVHRSDDTEESMVNRLGLFRTNITNLKDFYEDVLHVVDGSQHKDEVWEMVRDGVTKMTTNATEETEKEE